MLSRVAPLLLDFLLFLCINECRFHVCAITCMDTLVTTLTYKVALMGKGCDQRHYFDKIWQI